jgi:hypothetical protein
VLSVGVDRLINPFPLEYRIADIEPLVLLDRKDVLNELQHARTGVKQLDDEEETWKMSVSNQLVALCVIYRMLSSGHNTYVHQVTFT